MCLAHSRWQKRVLCLGISTRTTARQVLSWFIAISLMPWYCHVTIFKKCLHMLFYWSNSWHYSLDLKLNAELRTHSVLIWYITCSWKGRHFYSAIIAQRLCCYWNKERKEKDAAVFGTLVLVSCMECWYQIVPFKARERTSFLVGKTETIFRIRSDWMGTEHVTHLAKHVKGFDACAQIVRYVVRNTGRHVVWHTRTLHCGHPMCAHNGAF